MIDFTHLHVHTEYSLLDGANRIKDLIARTAQLGMKSIAITDHGVMYGVIEFYKEALKNGIKPIIGCEVYTARRTRFDRDPSRDSDQGHLVLLAENNAGYRNLMKLVSAGFTEGFYYKPRIDVEILRKYSAGIIALSACMSGDVPRLILENNYEAARQKALEFDDIFGSGNFYLELQSNGIEEQNLVNQQIIRLSFETGIPLAATNDVHYLLKENARAQDVLMCIQTGKTVNDEDRMRFNTDQLYLKSPEEMLKSFENIREAVENTDKIAQRCNVVFEFNHLRLPEFKLPEGIDAFDHLCGLSLEGLKRRYGDISLFEGSAEKARLDEELQIIKMMGYTDYFLIVWDFIRYAREKNIPVGPGRGSSAGSLVSYCLGITNIDPLKYNLIFERFLNPDRVSMPDIDIDFCYERRQEVIDYVVLKYGEERVAQIITFGTMAARAAIRDVGRALDIPYNEVDAIAKMVPFQIGMTIDRALELSSQLSEAYKRDLRYTELIDTAKLLEGMPRHASTHAAGVVISKDPITEHVPLQKNEDCITTQFAMGTLEELGLLKMDFLGLRTLTVIRNTTNLVMENYGATIEIDSISMDEKEVYDLIGSGNTAGIFQLESAGMTRFMKELKPDVFEDIIAGISLYRPGPMEQIPRYMENRKHPAKIVYSHPKLESILDVTYGCIIYQEQVMQIFRELAGYSMGRSDLVRRAISKKKLDVMKEERENFINGKTDENGDVIVGGALRMGLSEKVAAEIFDQMADFASYAFNKSHAAAYAVVAYQTAWLKYHYPKEFMASMLNSFIGSGEKVSFYVHECLSMSIEVLPPDINESRLGFTVQNGKIRFGLAAVKNVGESAVEQIIRERDEGGPFKDFRDFCIRICSADVNKRCLESMIKCGVFGTFGIYRSKLMAVYEKIIDSIQQDRKKNLEGQQSIFETINSSETIREDDSFPDIPEYDDKKLLAMEKEILGLYLSGHPLGEYEKELSGSVTIYSKDLKESLVEDSNAGAAEERNLRDGMSAVVGGIIAGKKMKSTKSDNLMAFIQLEDVYGTMEIIVFPQVLKKYNDYLTEENIVLIRGHVSMKEEEEAKIICEEVRPVLKNRADNNENTYSDAGKKSKTSDLNIKDKTLFIRINGDEGKSFLSSIYSLLKYFSGRNPVVIYDRITKQYTKLEKEYRADIKSPELIEELTKRLGEKNVVLK